MKREVTAPCVRRSANMAITTSGSVFHSGRKSSRTECHLHGSLVVSQRQGAPVRVGRPQYDLIAAKCRPSGHCCQQGAKKPGEPGFLTMRAMRICRGQYCPRPWPVSILPRKEHSSRYATSKATRGRGALSRWGGYTIWPWQQNKSGRTGGRPTRTAASRGSAGWNSSTLNYPWQKARTAPFRGKT